MTAPSNLSKCIVTPARLASIFDWKLSRIISLQICKHHINLSIAEHPNNEEQDGNITINALEPIPYMANEDTASYPKDSREAIFKFRKDQVKVELAKVANEFDVAGFVVGYPFEPNGRQGAPCGRVLHLLDHLADTEDAVVLSPRRRLTLWDHRAFKNNHFDELVKAEDEFGRSTAFCYQSSTKINEYITDEHGNKSQKYISNHREDYACQDDDSSRILEQFLGFHYLQNEDKQFIRQKKKLPFEQLVLNWERNGGKSVRSSVL